MRIETVNCVAQIGEVLTQGRYTWCHNTVLLELDSNLNKEHLSDLSREGKSQAKVVRTTSRLLDLAKDWVLKENIHVNLVIL